MSRGPSDLVHQLPPLPLLIIKCHLTLTVEIGMPRTPQMMQQAVQTAPRALYGLILHDGGVNTRGPKGYLITRVHYQTVQAWNLHPPHLSEPSSACRKSGSPCSCTAHPGIQLSSARSFGSIWFVLTWWRDPWHRWHCVHSLANFTWVSEVRVT